MRTINEIIIHCTATEAGNDFTVETIDKWHRDKGYDEIGYHFIIHPNGRIERGRDINKAGAHCYGHNSKSIGIAYIGGLRKGKPADTRTIQQQLALAHLILILEEIFPTITKVSGHNEYSNKACPCFDVRQWLIDSVYQYKLP